MKGIVFSEFIELVEYAFSPAIADRIVERSDLPLRGARDATAFRIVLVA